MPFRTLLFVCLLPFAALAQDAPPKAALCAGCHGAHGIPVNPTFPVIAGQKEGYLYLELRDYKLGNRKNAVMQAVTATLEKPDMRALAAWFAAQPWPDLRQPRPAADIAHRAETAANSAVCSSCHLEGYVGDSAVPRLAGQGAAYMRTTMAAFRSGERANNPWMVALLKTYSDADIDALAQYLAGL